MGTHVDVEVLYTFTRLVGHRRVTLAARVGDVLPQKFRLYIGLYVAHLLARVFARRRDLARVVGL